MATLQSSPTRDRTPLPDKGDGLLGVPSATALVMGSVVGTGVFTMPAVMAGAGTIAIWTLLAVSFCAIVLGVMFGQLTKRVPNADGGLYAYARHEFGDFAGYLTALCYWVTAWCGNAAIVSSWVMYMESLFGITHPSAWVNFGLAATGLWIPAAINLMGVRRMAWFQIVTVVLKFLPLAAVALFGWFFIKSGNFPGFNTTGGNLRTGISAAASVALFSFIGVECASIAAGRVRNPRRNVGRATVIGTAACALLYVLVTAAVMGLVPSGELAKDGAPFVAAFHTMFGSAWIVGKIVALAAVISGIGALNGWTMVTAEVPYAAAQDGMFPAMFGQRNRHGAVWVGIVISTVVATLLVGYSYSGATGLKVFNYLVSLSVVTVAIPYFLSACAQLAFLVSRRRKVVGVLLVRDLAISVLSMLFALWVTAASGYQAVYQALILIMIGLAMYPFLKSAKERKGLVPEPVDRLETV